MIVFEVLPGDLQVAFDRNPQATVFAVEKAMHRGALEVAREMRRKAPKAQSTLVNSTRAERAGRAEWLIAPGVQHGVFQDQGTEGAGAQGGSMPPV